MRFISYGAGGIGGVIGARLFQQDEEVVLIARGEHLQAIRDRGLRLRAPGEDVLLPLPVVAHPAAVEWREDDVVLLCIKSQHTSDALAALRAAMSIELPVICCQNGVANESMALRLFAKVYAMLVYMPAQHLEPGEVVTHASGCGGVLDAGCYPGGVDTTIERVTASLSRAGFLARPDPQVMRLKYAKLLTNLNNILQAVTQPGTDARTLGGQLRDEALACYAAAGIDCADSKEARRLFTSQLSLGEVEGCDLLAGSSWQSIRRGTGNIETDYLNGEIVLLGRLHGVPTPANAAMQSLALRLLREGLAPGSIPLAEVTAEVRRFGGR